jgi:tetratricopeptide (TPR) repeat protein
MSMATQENSMTARLARWVLRFAVRHWPEENRAWGLALAAEIDETASAFEMVRWSLGGIMFFTRSVLSSVWNWMKLPSGSSLSGGANGPDGPSLLPKRSRVFTATVLAAAALLLALPEGREAIRTVRASWQEHRQSDPDAPTLEKLAARAEKANDANALAFVALRTEDPKRAEALTERAVAIDPQLIWVYGSKNHSWPNFEPPKAEWLARLQAADPDNAVPYLLEAYAVAGQHVRSLYEHGTPKDADFEMAESDSRWMALMEQAYSAPRYDSYFEKHCQLTRVVWTREKNLTALTVLSGLWSHAIPNLLNVRNFADVKIHEAQKARMAGEWKRAESLLDEVDMFGMRMRDGSGTNIEKVIGWSVSRRASKEMAVLYSSLGKTEDARRATLRIQQIDESFQALRPGHDSADHARVQTFRREAMLVQGFGTLAVIAGLAALAGVLMLELWPSWIRNSHTIWRRAICWTSDYAPSVLLAASGAFLISFLPFQRAFEEYRASNYSLLNEQRVMESMWGLLEIPQSVTGVNFAVSIWTFVTVALSALLLFVLARGFYRMRRTLSKPA